MVLAAHFLQRVADSAEEVLVGVQYLAVERELDDRLHAVDGHHHPFVETDVGDVLHLNDIAGRIATLVEVGAHVQCELPIADGNVGLHRHAP